MVFKEVNLADKSIFICQKYIPMNLQIRDKAR